MKSFSVFFIALFVLLGSASAVAMMRATSGEVLPPQKSQHETKKHSNDKTQSPHEQQNYQSVPLTVPVKQNR